LRCNQIDQLLGKLAGLDEVSIFPKAQVAVMIPKNLNLVVQRWIAKWYLNRIAQREIAVAPD
jgi:hypothetical protein